MAGQLSGKTALVTGAAQGMGFAIAECFAREGAQVVLSDVQRDKAEARAGEIRSAGGSALPVAADVSREDEVARLVEAGVEAYGRIDILVNNAGILRSTPFEEISLEEWELILRVNVNGVFLCSRAVLPLMKRNGWGRMVHISSSAGKAVSTIGGAHYTASKAAVLGLSRAIAREAGPHGVTSNAICPGMIETDMARAYTPSEEALQKLAEPYPIPRLGRPEEVARLALFLAGDDAAYITGASIDINGGDLMI